jgi:hypothetical protein
MKYLFVVIGFARAGSEAKGADQTAYKFYNNRSRMFFYLHFC